MLPSVKNNFSDFVDEFFGRDLLSSEFFRPKTGINMPAVNIVEGSEDFKIEVAAPGLEKDDFKIDLENNVLTISSEKEEKNEKTKDAIVRREFSYSAFKRSFSLPATIDTEKISALHKDGILHICIPKKEEAKQKPPRKIDIL